jgi:hypothetical protein
MHTDDKNLEGHTTYLGVPVCVEVFLPDKIEAAAFFVHLLDFCREHFYNLERKKNEVVDCPACISEPRNVDVKDFFESDKIKSFMNLDKVKDMFDLKLKNRLRNDLVKHYEKLSNQIKKAINSARTFAEAKESARTILYHRRMLNDTYLAVINNVDHSYYDLSGFLQILKSEKLKVRRGDPDMGTPDYTYNDIAEFLKSELGSFPELLDVPRMVIKRANEYVPVGVRKENWTPGLCVRDREGENQPVIFKFFTRLEDLPDLDRIWGRNMDLLRTWASAGQATRTAGQTPGDEVDDLAEGIAGL